MPARNKNISDYMTVPQVHRELFSHYTTSLSVRAIVLKHPDAPQVHKIGRFAFVLRSEIEAFAKVFNEERAARIRVQIQRLRHGLDLIEPGAV